MIQLIILWLPYYILGYVGNLFHIWSKPTPGVSVWQWIKQNIQDVVISVIAYNVLIFFWVDSGIEFIGMLKGVPTGLTFFLGYFAQSVLGHLIQQFGNKIEDKQE